MINLTFHNGITFIFNAEDWYNLRTKHRIVGDVFGTYKHSHALPVSLCPEQSYLLVKNKIAKLVHWKHLENEPTSIDKSNYEEKCKQQFEEQKLVHFEERQKQVEAMIDKIIEGKKRKGFEVSREDVLEEEKSKLEVVEEAMVTQIYSEHPDYLKGPYTEISVTELEKYTNPIKCAVFEDLWRKEYFITTGRKFGGDFLVYLGDPVAFHAVYIVKCVEETESQNPTELVTLGRLGNSVKKKYVFATLTPSGEVSYLTLTWEDI